MATLASALLVKNEADKYLERVLRHCLEYSDKVLVLDDGSTDESRDIAKRLGCSVRQRSGESFWGTGEVPARRELWEWMEQECDWGLVTDADMLLEGDVRALTETWECTAWAFPLVDLWDSEDTFRVDGAWQFGPTHPRPWLFRPSALQVAPVWNEGCVHVGHSPANFAEAGPTFVAPPDVFWKHLSYVKREHRERKAAAYASVAHTMSDFQRQHAASILDE